MPKRLRDPLFELSPLEALWQHSLEKGRKRRRNLIYGTYTRCGIEHFRKLDLVGKGTYGCVHKMKSPNGTEVAIKEMDYVGPENRSETKNGFSITAVREIKILRSLNHKNIVELYDVISSGGNGHTIDVDAKVHMVFEFCKWDLAMLRRRHESMELKHIKFFLREIACGLSYIHNVAGVLHRDIKPSNVLVNVEGEVKLADFGLARIQVSRRANTNAQLTKIVVTQWYRSPELLLLDRHYGPPVDMWSFGCVFGELLLGRAIFKGKNGDDLDQLTKIMDLCGTPTKKSWPQYASYTTLKPKGEYPCRIRAQFGSWHLGEEGFKLLEALLTMNPDRRITAKKTTASKFFTTKPKPQKRRWLS